MIHEDKERLPAAQRIDAFDSERLLKHLVRKVTAFSVPPKALQPAKAAIDEIIFESNIDGTHYYLVRRKPETPQPVELSPRELAIAHLIAQGLPNKSIGSSLNISPWTVATHLRRIFVKLGVTSRAAMVARLMQDHLLSQ